MAIVDFITDRRNLIRIGGASGVGLIIAASALVFGNWVRPALQIEEPDGDVRFTLSDHGAIGVQSGSGVSFGATDDCLKSGGGSGSSMTFGSCASGSSGGGGDLSGTGAVNQLSYFTGQKTLSGSDVLWSDSQKRLTLVGVMSGSTVYATKSFSGAGLVDCDTAGTSKLLWDATTARYSCGTDTDTNTTYTAGQNLTLAGTSFSLNTTITGSLVRFQTLSGSTVFANRYLASSGSLVWKGQGSGANLYIGGTFEGVGLTDCDAATQTVAWDATTKRFSCGTDSDITYTAGRGLGLTSTSFSLNSTITGSLVRFTTLSGSDVFAKQYLASSGSLTWKTNGSGSKLYAGYLSGTTLSGFGLSDCDTAGTSKLLWDSTTRKFSCGTDTDTTYKAGQGLSLTSTTFSLNTTITGSLVRFTTLSGSIVYANKTLTSSGTLNWRSIASGAQLYVGGTFDGVGLTDCDLATQTLAWDATTKRFSCGTDSDTTYTAGQGLTLSTTSFKLSSAFSGTTITIYGSASGKYLHAERGLNSSGSLVVSGTTNLKGTTSGALITATTLSGTTIRATNYSSRRVQVEIVSTGSTITTGSGKMMYTIGDPTMSGYYLKSAHLSVQVSGTTNTTEVQIRNASKGNRKLFSTRIGIDSAENGSDTAATPYVISTTNRDVGAYDRLLFDIAAVSATAPKGSLQIFLEFYKP